MTTQSELPVIKTNDVKKGAKVIFFNGKEGEVMDNKRGNLRMVKVEVIFQPGMYDIGDDYAHNWEFAVQNGVKYLVDHTDSQGKTRDLLHEMGFD